MRCLQPKGLISSSRKGNENAYTVLESLELLPPNNQQLKEQVSLPGTGDFVRWSMAFMGSIIVALFLYVSCASLFGTGWPYLL